MCSVHLASVHVVSYSKLGSFQASVPWCFGFVCMHVHKVFCLSITTQVEPCLCLARSVCLPGTGKLPSLKLLGLRSDWRSQEF